MFSLPRALREWNSLGCSCSWCRLGALLQGGAGVMKMELLRLLLLLRVEWVWRCSSPCCRSTVCRCPRKTRWGLVFCFSSQLRQMCVLRRGDGSGECVVIVLSLCRVLCYAVLCWAVAGLGWAWLG